MTHLVYPLKGRSPTKHTELRYSLRSVERCAQGPIAVTLITDRPPKWYKGEVLECGDKGRKRVATTAKLMAFMEADPPEQWVLMCDDFYLMADVDLSTVPLQRGPDLRSEAARFRMHPRRSNRIADVWDRTASICEEHGLETWSFERHAPFRIRTDLWERCPGMDRWPEEIQPQSLYGNWAVSRGEQYEDAGDLKFFRHGWDDENWTWDPDEFDEATEGRWCWSTADDVARMASFRHFMSERFPEPSRWEK